MNKIKVVWSKTNRWHRAFLLFVIIEMKVLPTGQRGFTCNDPALSHTFNGDTVNMKHLFGTILLLPLAAMLLVERMYHTEELSNPKKQALRWYKEYTFGVILNLIVVQGIKLAVGAPRPHFFDTCSPSEALTCQGGEFVPRYSCTKTQHWTSESSKSFPSGHTSLAVHAGVFLAYYLYRRAANSTTVKLCQAVALVGAVYCGVSRMWDHRHHWWDVLGGAVLAAPILLYTIFYLCRNFEPKKKNIQEPKSIDNNVTDKLDVSDKPLLDAKEALNTQ